MRTLIAKAALLLMVPALASAQSEDHRYRGEGYFFFGWGPDTSRYHRLVEHTGFGGEGFLYKGFGVGMEVGYAHWAPRTDENDAWIASGDVSHHFRRNAPRGRFDPFVLIGVTGFFPTSVGRGVKAGNFGGGVDLWLTEPVAMRFEVRDHVNQGSAFNLWPGTHYISFRIGLTFR
jgi:hypothetical protein